MLRYLPFKFTTLLAVWLIICAITLVTCYAMNLDIVGYGLVAFGLAIVSPFKKPKTYSCIDKNGRWIET